MTTMIPTDCILSKGGVQVTIPVTKWNVQFTKSVKALEGTTITTSENGGVGSPKKEMKYFDINRNAEYRFDIDGYIHTDYPLPATSTDTHDDVNEKMDDLYAMFFAVGSIRMQFYGIDKTIFIDKIAIDVDVSDESVITKMKVKFTAMQGVAVYE